MHVLTHMRHMRYMRHMRHTVVTLSPVCRFEFPILRKFDIHRSVTALYSRGLSPNEYIGTRLHSDSVTHSMSVAGKCHAQL